MVKVLTQRAQKPKLWTAGAGGIFKTKAKEQDRWLQSMGHKSSRELWGARGYWQQPEVQVQVERGSQFKPVSPKQNPQPGPKRVDTILNQNSN